MKDFVHSVATKRDKFNIYQMSQNVLEQMADEKSFVSICIMQRNASIDLH
jgi:hypothetical protein